MQYSRKFLIGSLIVVVLGLALWGSGMTGGWFKGGAKANSDSAEQSDGQSGDKKQKMENAFQSLDKRMGGKETPITVEAEPARRGELIQTVSAQGRVFGYSKVDVINEVPGRLTKLNYRDGQVVKKDQILAEIDDRQYQLEFDDAKAKYLAQKAEYVVFDRNLQDAEKGREDRREMIQELQKKHDSGLISEDEFRRQKLTVELDDLRSGKLREEVIAAKTVDQAWVVLQKAQLNLEKCKVQAPFDGIIFGVQVSAGAVLGANTKLCQIVDLKDVVIKAQILESEIGQVYAGRPARVKFTALPDVGEIAGTVLAVSPTVNEEDKTVETIIKFQSNDNRIRPGMFADVRIDSRIFEDRLMVPKLAILPRDDRKVVFKVGEDNRAKWIYVKTGVENDLFVEIVEGTIEPGDLVLTDNHFTMGHDTLVKVVDSTSESDSDSDSE